MMVRKGMTSAALLVLACVSAARAAESSSPAFATSAAASSTDLSLMPSASTPVYADDSTSAPAAPAETTLTPLMYLLSQPGPQNVVGNALSAANINITGFGEFGYFYDASAPRISQQPTLIDFPGAYSNRGLLDQADIMISRTVNSSGNKIDFGFQVEAGYGVDDSYTHSDGILDNRPPGHPETQFDLLQANFSVFLPVGTGLTIQAGKFVTLLGEETINPTGNLLFTHSYLFTFGIPLTQTGVLGSYTFNNLIAGQPLTVTAGITRGWNQSTKDNNGAIDFLGEAVCQITPKLKLTFNVSEGPEATHDNSDYWSVFEGIASYALSDNLTLSVDTLYADAPHLSAVSFGRSAQWYSACGYASYKFNSYATLNGRGEWYRDNDGFTTGTAANYYEGTLGVDIHPLPNDNIFQYLQFRPEARYDFSDKAVYNFAHDGGKGDFQEFTAAVDAIMQF